MLWFPNYFILKELFAEKEAKIVEENGGKDILHAHASISSKFPAVFPYFPNPTAPESAAPFPSALLPAVEGLGFGLTVPR